MLLSRIILAAILLVVLGLCYLGVVRILSGARRGECGCQKSGVKGSACQCKDRQPK